MLDRTWFIKYNNLVKMGVHFLGLTVVSLKILASCKTVVFSKFWKGLPPSTNDKLVYKATFLYVTYHLLPLFCLF